MTKPRIPGMNLRLAVRAEAAELAELERIESLSVEGVRELARSYTAEAVNILRILMKNPKIREGVRRQAALDLIAIGYPEMKAVADAPVGRAGMTINILRLSDGAIEVLDNADRQSRKAALPAVRDALGLPADEERQDDAGAEAQELLHGGLAGGARAGDGPDDGEVRLPLRDVPERE